PGPDFRRFPAGRPDAQPFERRRALRAQPRAGNARQRLPHPSVGHPAGDPAVSDPQAAHRQRFPELARAAQALVAVVAEAYVKGVSTLKVTVLVQPLGIIIIGLSNSVVSRLCQSLDEQVEAFRARRLDAESSYVWL